jgi:hypothetical protein
MRFARRKGPVFAKSILRLQSFRHLDCSTELGNLVPSAR